MNRAQLQQLLINVLTEIQTSSGRTVPTITDEFKPMEDLDGFDSLNAEEATTMLAAKLEIEINENPFFGEDEALTLSAVVDRVLVVCQGTGVRVHAGR